MHWYLYEDNQKFDPLHNDSIYAKLSPYLGVSSNQTAAYATGIKNMILNNVFKMSSCGF